MKDYFDKPKGWTIPYVEVFNEYEGILARYDIQKEEPKEGYEESDNEPYTSRAVRVSFPITYNRVLAEVTADGCEGSHAEDVSKAIIDEYKPNNVNNDEED